MQGSITRGIEEKGSGIFPFPSSELRKWKHYVSTLLYLPGNFMLWCNVFLDLAPKKSCLGLQKGEIKINKKKKKNEKYKMFKIQKFLWGTGSQATVLKGPGHILWSILDEFPSQINSSMAGMIQIITCVSCIFLLVTLTQSGYNTGGLDGYNVPYTRCS